MRITTLGSQASKCAALIALCTGLVACGGGSSGSALDNLNGGGGGNGNGSSSSAGNELAQIGRGSGDNFVPGEIGKGIGDNTLSAGGNTLLSVNVVNNGSLITDSVAVTFSSPCIAAGEALLSPQTGGTCEDGCPTDVVQTSNGQATIRYTANGCIGSDTIKATTTYGGSVISAETTIDVAADTVTSLRFIDASPSLITLKGSGGIETSTLRFRVLGSTGAPVKDVDVNFALSRTSGGLQLVSSSGTSGVDGYVYTTVQAGTVPGPVQVIATTDGGITTQSIGLVLSSGLPDQNSFSIAASDVAPPSWNTDGVESTITVRAADAFNNPAPIGTPIYFTASGAAIDGDCLITPDDDNPERSSGSCSVNWTSQEPRQYSDVNFSINESSLTLECPPGVAECRDGRLKIIATTLGNESFIDTNGNGLFDLNEDVFYTADSTEGNAAARAINCLASQPVSGSASHQTSGGISNAFGCDDLGSPYLDRNFNGAYDSNEEIATIDGETETQYSSGNGLYNGVLCRPADADAGLCSRDPVLVRADMTLVMSCSRPLRTSDGRLPGQPTTPVVLGPNQVKSVRMLLADCNGNGIPAGSETTAYDEVANNADVVVSPDGVWPSSQEYGYVTLFITAGEEPPSGAAGIDVTIGGNTWTFLIPIEAQGFPTE
ncbi:hypothetical protein [Gilvimarinus algae]|uniref:Big-1 domain-containing protein n=1 Tax=Gilvimarinus algae TaxID=3058037 RepID=A0ABT8TBL9_9GAMM|nr:hypothetical protein [Gilvimarinus sp. SDUM040014]MDO3381040.1 hypothetical protein [Gilvimarinus sp. SDUM040014]